jgi:hypothetical protein
MKTAAPITTLTESFWSQLISAPVQIIPDPTDLIALIVLIPAWKLWQRPPRPTRHPHPLIGWTALCLASLASLATSCENIPLINRLVIVDDALYALGDTFHDSVARYDPTIEGWIKVDEPSPLLLEQLTTPPLPVTACVPDQPQLCYQITGDEKVYASADGGQTWDIAWEIPLGRRDFMARYLGNDLVSSCKSKADIGPYDLVIVPAGPTYRLVVAMGNEGVLVHDPAGEWLRQDVLGARPTPFAIFTLSQGLWLLIQEELTLLLVALFTLFFLVGIATRSLKPLISPFLLTIFLGGPLAFLALYIFYSAAGALFIMIVVPIVTLVDQWRRADWPWTPSNKTLMFWLLTGLALFVLASIPFWLWLFAIIPVYQWAVLLSVVLVILLLWFAGRYFLHLSKTDT